MYKNIQNVICELYVYQIDLYDIIKMDLFYFKIKFYLFKIVKLNIYVNCNEEFQKLSII